MIRYINRNILSFFSTKAKIYTAKGYQIAHKQYLIEAPPKRPLNSYNIYYMEKFGKAEGELTTDKAKTIGEEWNKLTEEEKKKYEEKAHQYSEAYKIAKAEYEKKYTENLKRVSGTNLFLKDLYTSGAIKKEAGKTIAEYGKESGALIKNMTPEKKEEFKKQAQELKKARHDLLAKYKFPVKEYDTQRQWNAKYKLPKEKLTPARRQELEKGFKDYQSDHAIKTITWLKENNIKLTYEEFQKLYQQTMKKPKKEKVEQEVEE